MSGEFRILHPYILLAIPAVWTVALLLRKKSSQRTLLFSALPELKNAPTTWRQRASRYLLPGLRWAAAALLIIALARPQDVERHTWIEGQGIDIALAIDTSGSMNIIDMDPRGDTVKNIQYYRTGLFGPVYKIGQVSPDVMDRMKVVKAVVGKFITQRKGDLLTIIVFGTEARTLCPLTHDVQTVAQLLQQVEVGMVGEMTDLKKAILYSLKRLIGLTVEDVIEMAKRRSEKYILQKIKNSRTSFIFDKETEEKIREAQLSPRIVAAMKAKKPRSQIIILITDGKHTATPGEEGRREVLEAAKAAAAYKIKIYTIGIGSKKSYTYIRRKELGPDRVIRIPNDSYDEDLMRRIAELTGGKFFTASDKYALENVYREINRLEPNKYKVHQWEKTREYYPYLIIAALLLLLSELFLKKTLLRKLP